MQLDSIQGIVPLSAVKNTGSTENNSADSNISFSDCLKKALDEVNDLQLKASQSAEKLALGDESYLHNTVIAYEKANLALELTIEIRNKIVEAYQEIMRIQM